MVFCQDNEMVAGRIALFFHLVFLFAVSHVHLAAVYGLEVHHTLLLFQLLLNLRLAVAVNAISKLGPEVGYLALGLSFQSAHIVGKFLHSHHVAVVGDGHAAHSVGNGLVHDVRDF